MRGRIIFSCFRQRSPPPKGGGETRKNIAPYYIYMYIYIYQGAHKYIYLYIYKYIYLGVREGGGCMWGGGPRKGFASLSPPQSPFLLYPAGAFFFKPLPSFFPLFRTKKGKRGSGTIKEKEGGGSSGWGGGDRERARDRDNPKKQTYQLSRQKKILRLVRVFQTIQIQRV